MIQRILYMHSFIPLHSLTKQLPHSTPQPKLDALASVIIHLNNHQLQYLTQLLNNSPFLAKSYSLSSHQYFEEERKLKQVWDNNQILRFLVFPQGDTKAKVEEKVKKEIYDFQLTTIDQAQKIKVIKLLRELLNLGLKEAKDFADKPPVIIKKGKLEEGEKMRDQLAKVGSILTLK